MHPRLRYLVGSTVGILPVTIRRGAAQGARWTLFPWSSYWRGTHEPEVQAAIMSLGGGNISGWNCWDLGAHFGLYSVALALRVGPEGQVAAFEPNPVSFARLERHRRMNGLDRLKTYQAAASNQSGYSELLTYGDLGSTSSHLLYQGETQGASTVPIAIRTLRLDDEVDSGYLKAPQFIKIDVEGHAHKALEGMRQSVSRSRPRLFIAFHSPDEVEGVLALLKPLGYRWSVIGTPPPNPETLIGGDYFFTPSETS